MTIKCPHCGFAFADPRSVAARTFDWVVAIHRMKEGEPPKSIASDFGVKPAALSIAFKKHTGITLREWRHRQSLVEGT